MWERNSSYYCMENGSDSSISPRAMKEKKNKRRFSDEQIKSLETMFDSESKLEPRRKMQLARELGLQPRQIAIWFQNRRARCKTKQLEREYSVLRSNYDTLVSSFESLKQEKQALLKQLQKLRDLIEKPRGSSSDSEYGEEKTHYKEKPKSLLEQGSDSREVVCSDGEDSKNTGYCEKPEPLSMAEVELVCGSLEFPEKLSDLDNSCYVDQSSSSSLQWWELWP